MSTSRLGGDFDYDALNAFRVAYADQMQTPEDHDIDERTGLPTENISNTSPWIEHTGLWKANDGLSRDFQPNQPFNPEEYYDTEEEEEEEYEDDDDELTEDELNALIEELLEDEG